MIAAVFVFLASSALEEGTQMRNIGEYARAAELFENAGDKTALRDAIVLRLGLGDETRALADAEKFLRDYGNDVEAPTVAAAIILHEADREDWSATTRESARKMTIVDRGPIALRMQTHAALARAEAATHDPRASREYARVREMSRELGATPADPNELRRFAQGLNAYGEALVFAADEMRDAGTSPLSVIEAEYRKVTEIQPEPPPRWVVAAAAHSAAMWTRAADALVQHLSPKQRKERVPLRDVTAKQAAKACVDYAAKYQWSDEGSRACAAWLEKTYRSEYPPLDEITPSLRAASPVLQAPLPRP